MIALSAAIALNSERCITSYTKAAKRAGATNEEIIETFAVARHAKGTSALSSFVPALEWLKNNS